MQDHLSRTKREGHLFQLSEKTECGVWVTSLDTFLPFTPAIACPIPSPGPGVGALVCTVQMPLDLATHHGVVLSEEGHHISNMVYRMPLEDLS